MVLWDLFITFFTIGFVSFGGGYAMIPVIERQVTDHGWMSTQEFTDVIAVAGMSPGPIGTNSAVFVGYSTAGFWGAVFSAAGMILPSLILVVLIATYFYRINQNTIVQSAFYGLRPIVTGLIIYGAIRFANSNGLIGELSSKTVITACIFAASLFALTYMRLHPFYVIVLSGLVGTAIFG